MKLKMKFGLALTLASSMLVGTACGDLTDTENPEALTETGQALTPVHPALRPSIHDLSVAEREELVDAILDFITQPVLTEHAQGHDWHNPSVGELFFSRHHDYLNQLEAYLVANGYQHLVPLPEWNPGTPIPSEFLVTDPLVSQAALNANPNQPMPAQFNDLCSFPTTSELAVNIETWHDGVHVAVGGAMGNVSQAPGAPIFWLWHGFLDGIYHDYTWECVTFPALLPALVAVL